MKAAKPATVERILTSVPALRGAGLDEVADSIEEMARELGVGGEADPEPLVAREKVSRGPGGPAGKPRVAATPALATRLRHGLGGAIIVALAGAGRVTGWLSRARRTVRHGLIRRRELVWGVVAVASMSLVVGWVISRLG